MNPHKSIRSVLVVDDEVLNTELLQTMLVEWGFEVFTAYDGENAIEQCLSFLTFNKKVDIIFMDYSMPLMNGDVCTQKLRSSKFDPILKDTPIVGLTAHRDDKIANNCLSAGMTMIEYKPISFIKIQNILEKYHLLVTEKGHSLFKTLSIQTIEHQDTIPKNQPVSIHRQISTQKTAKKSCDDSEDEEPEEMDEEYLPI
jgi:CheY-like chemotaxis protein